MKIHFLTIATQYMLSHYFQLIRVGQNDLYMQCNYAMVTGRTRGCVVFQLIQKVKKCNGYGNTVISTEGALRLPTTYDNQSQPNPTQPNPSHPHIAVKTTSPRKM